jgi:hypothetical protein
MMLLNEFLKEHLQVQQLKATVARQQQDFEAKLTQEQIEVLTYTVRKVGERVEPKPRRAQIVANNE